jgi:prepilin-type processing-associated H-X9-DG protein/prepilin-type N-terminal cleavage/methylation domain-containing protein
VLAGSSAFTLLELLSVLAVVGILFSLITGTIMATKRKARLVHCQHNLRQHGLALGAFLAEHGEYPLGSANASTIDQHPVHGVIWRVSLYPERWRGRAGGGFDRSPVDDCPAASRPVEFPRDRGYEDFGYNSCGLGGPVMAPMLGIGGSGPGLVMNGDLMEASWPPPVKESEVVNPSEMLAIGDGFVGWKGIVHDGVSTIGRGPNAQEYLNSTVRSRRRHQGLANMQFCDGHVNALRLSFLFEAETDRALRIWNRDNQPHRERLAP